ncbi:terminase small subunit [Hoeflea sp. TYP-13]|uniref:terminase small subunit n=1 Tax=Hoeflea sp. TYP-13 TaxID=3230023 RepID=UPI0034C61246
MDLKSLTRAQIRALVKQHPLPKSVDDVVLNREDLAAAMGVSINTITQWIASGMPVAQEGGNGKAYELQLSHCWAWRQASNAAEEQRSAEAKKAIQALRLELIGGASGESLDALGPKEKREIMAAQREQELFQAARNSLMKRDDVRELLEQMFAIFRDTLDAAPDRVERIEAISPKAVGAFVEVCDELLKEMERRIRDFWDLRPERGEEYLKRDMFDA